MPILRKLLWIDCTAAFLAGTIVLLLARWLSQLYALPYNWLVGMGIVNLVYGLFSCSLAVRAQRPRPLILLLILANAGWALVCWCAAALLVGTASVFGMAHLLGEGLFVGGLATLEWKWCEQLLAR